MLYRTCPSWQLHVVVVVVSSKRTLVGSHLVFTLEKRWQPVRWEVKEVQKVKGRVGRVGEVSRSCTCNFTLMIHYRWKMNKRSLMILRWMMDFVVFLSWFCLFQHSLSLSLSSYNLSPMKHLLFLYLYISWISKPFSGPTICRLSVRPTARAVVTVSTLRTVQALYATFLVRNTHTHSPGFHSKLHLNTVGSKKFRF